MYNNINIISFLEREHTPGPGEYNTDTNTLVKTTRYVDNQGTSFPQSKKESIFSVSHYGN